MNFKKITVIVTFIVFPLMLLSLAIYDVIAIQQGGTEASISSLIIAGAYKMPFMVFITGNIIGILEGHLFWRMKTNKDTEKIDKLK